MLLSPNVKKKILKPNNETILKCKYQFNQTDNYK